MIGVDVPEVGLEALWDEANAWSVQSWPGLVRPFAAVVLALTVFGVDTFTSLAGAVAVLYCPVLLVASEGRQRSAILWSGGACLSLAFASFAFNHGLLPDAAPDFRFLFSVAAILTTASLLLQNAKSRRMQRAQARLLDLTTDAIILRTSGGAVLLWSRGAEALYGWPAEAVIGSQLHEVIASTFETDRAEAKAALLEIGYWTGAIEQKRKDGTSVWVSSRWQLMRTRKGDPWGILETNTDITARRAAEAQLRQSERRYRDIFETLAVGILEYDFLSVKLKVDAVRASGATDLAVYYGDHPALLAKLRTEVRIVDANEAAARLIGCSDRNAFVTDHSSFLPISDHDFLRCLTALGGTEPVFESAARTTNANGDKLSLVFAMTLPPDGDGFDRVQASITDLTHAEQMSDEISRMRADLDQALRTATIAEVSATIAHEVNQPLAAIRTNAAAARRWLGQSPPSIDEATEALGGVIDAVDRAGQVVKKVRQYFDRGGSALAPVTIDAMIKDTMRLIAREVSESGTHLTLHLGADDARVLGSRLLLQQCIVSLLINAIQAMRSIARSQREILIRSKLRNDRIIVTIKDAGPGFPTEIVERTLDAFFHTQQGGLGLGLAICRSTILSIGGDVEFSNDPAAGGAVVSLMLPVDLAEDDRP